LLANEKKISYTVRLGRWELKDCRLTIGHGEGQGLEAGTRAGMFKKTKEISEYDQPIQDLENPDDEVQIREGQR
jgi:hypothetical protein